MKDKIELGQLFENNFDCYADVFPRHDVIMAMTKDKFISVVESEVKEALEAQRVEIVKTLEEFHHDVKDYNKVYASNIVLRLNKILEALKGDKDA